MLSISMINIDKIFRVSLALFIDISCQTIHNEPEQVKRQKEY